MSSIEKIKVGNETHFVIHNNGKKRILTNKNTIKVLLEICHKNNRYFGKRNTMENVDNIIKEFDSYYNKKIKRDKKLKIINDNIQKIENKVKLIKRMPMRGKIVIASGLAAVIGLASLGISSFSKNDKTVPINIPTTTIEEIPEYIDDFENIEMSAPPIVMDDVLDTNNERLALENITINNQEIIAEENGNELNQMIEENNAFHFSYTDRTNDESLSNARRYEDLFEKYGNRYGVDPNLLMAIAAQESSGNHYDHLKGNYGIGMMQIEKGVWLGHSVSAYNFETGEKDKINITQEALEDLETNIQIGTMIWRNRIEENNYNIAIGTQEYNYGPGNMDKVFSSFNYATGITKGDLRNDYYNVDWLKYRDVVNQGDSLYVEHVFSYIENGTIITIKTRDGNDINLKIVNDKVNEKQMV